MSAIKTYPEANERLKQLLNKSNEFEDQYAAARIVELEKEVMRLRETLEFYADEEVYESKNATDTDDMYDPFRLIDLDEGKRARRALENFHD